MKIKTGMEDAYAKYVRVNSEDPYSKCVVTFGEEWMKRMEARIEKGEKVADIFDAVGREVDKLDGMGISGFMYGAAASALAKYWEHGEEFRKAYNKDMGAPDAKGTVNPALLSISMPKKPASN